MKMKEKKTEEVVEEVVETPKISNELREYLEFARFCVHQNVIFTGCCYEIEQKDDILKRLGLDVSEPVSIITGFTKETIGKEYDEFVQNWIDRYNELDLSKIDNYTKAALLYFIPNVYEVTTLKEKFKKCARHTTEE